MYPTGADIRELLPVEDPPVSEAQCDAFVDEWVSLIKEAFGNPEVSDGSEETALASRIVRRGAWADAMEQLMTISGYVGDPDAVSNVRTWAENALERYDTEHTTPEEATSEAAVAYLTETPW